MKADKWIMMSSVRAVRAKWKRRGMTGVKEEICGVCNHSGKIMHHERRIDK